MSAWRRYDSHLMPVFHERFEARWGKGTAPFLDPEAHEAPLPRAQWINIDTGAALAVVPIWTADDSQHRSFGVFYLPPPATSGCCGRGTRAIWSPQRMRPNSSRHYGTTHSKRPWRTPRNSCSDPRRRRTDVPRELLGARTQTGTLARSWRGDAPRPKISQLPETT